MIVDRARVAAVVPNYVLGEQLGAGAFGLVLRAEHRRMRRPAAIKVMPAQTAEGERIDFAAEARLLGGLDHPHVVRVYDYIEADDLCLVVMELLAGGTLTRQRAGMRPEQACAVGLAVSAALSHAHARNVLHRDVKADNILFAADGTVKVGDFGIAKLFEGSATTASKVAGTPVYMAPEQIEGGRLVPATDLYALGIVLYRLLTGRPPFDPKLPLHILWRRQLTEPAPPMEGVAAPVAEVVLHALEKNPAARQSDATAFALALARATAAAFGAGWIARAGLPLHLDDVVRRIAEGLPAAEPPVGRTPDAPESTTVRMEASTVRTRPATGPGGPRAVLDDGGAQQRPESRRPGGPESAAEVFARLRRTHGPEHPDTLEAANALAVRLSARGDHRAARGLDEDTLARRRRALGPDHPDTLTSAHNLAVDLVELGERPAARDLYEDTLARRRRALGPDHPDTLDSATDLGILLNALGDHESARHLGEDTLVRRRRTLGPDHPDTLNSAYNLAVRLSALGDHRAARDLGEDTFARRRRVLGPDHPDTLTSAYNLAVYLGKLGRYREARALGEQVRAGRRRILGADHPDALAVEEALQWWTHQDSAGA
ncbi:MULTISPECIES: serine/threonine-protein kinase [unclassified Parafrankia]|uniref:serine/threonine-protein kinase n=1 Tax=unclassified Parafrankia TaxID=2994368 RepID=UPI000DA59B2B|nr:MULTISPECIES: serine/threonine-protein kinase [unclassified Parafrankia]TCJ40587.1 serine/threonine protein kinase [Parafrankia sp. BMG5.11]SQD97509.1 Serine/threonine protein kinase [Parafrankia sp. Ea1.12]